MPVLEQVLELYPERVKIAFKHFPLRSHTFARQAALAAASADRQGKFWAFHDRLFEHFDDLGEEKVDVIARELNLDLEAFNASRRDPDVARSVQQDLQDGIGAGVRGTPTIFVNGKRLERRGVDDFRAAIEDALERVERQSNKGTPQ